MTKIANKLDIFRKFIYQNYGIQIKQEKNYMLEAKLQKALKVSNYKDIKKLLNDADYQKDINDKIISSITTNHTFFLREADHFTFLVRDIIKNQIKKPIIWCAASASGEEVYSIAISLLEAGITNYLIIASDIDMKSLFKLKTGKYSNNKTNLLNSVLKKKYFREKKDERGEIYYHVKEYLKKNIIIKRINLINSLNLEKNVNYIFCRNVFIYFDNINQKKVLLTLLANLKKNGCIFLGHSENLLTVGLPGNLKIAAPSVYRKGYDFGSDY
jgi:chemotaxis protein methyltransferase CheR